MFYTLAMDTLGVNRISMRKTVVCRACDGDGIVIADDDTPPDERVTRDSKRCRYCNGKGYVSDSTLKDLPNK